VKFIPHQFHLSVDTTQRIINVTKGDQLDSQAERDFDPSTATFGAGLGVLAQRAMRQVMTLAMINISVYTSVVGDGMYLPAWLLSLINLLVLQALESPFLFPPYHSMNMQLAMASRYG
jgi:hypothetical protein